MNATPAFGPLAIPFFVEKLMAGYPVTKVAYVLLYNALHMKCRTDGHPQRDLILCSCLWGLASTSLRPKAVGCHQTRGEIRITIHVENVSLFSSDIPSCRLWR